MNVYLMVLGHWYHHYWLKLQQYRSFLRRLTFKRGKFSLLPYERTKVRVTFLGRSAVESEKDKAFKSAFADEICRYLEHMADIGTITYPQRDVWYATFGKFLPDLRQKVKPKRTREEMEQSIALLASSLPAQKTETNPLLAVLRRSTLCTKA